MNGKAKSNRQPRILLISPEITYLPRRMGNLANYLSAKSGGMADVSASLVAALYELGADVHVALPHYRRMFNTMESDFIDREMEVYHKALTSARIHLALDRAFFYRDDVYADHAQDASKLSLALQREVINNIIPKLNPDIIHCNDWMTGLIPAMAKSMKTPCLFTVHNIHTQHLTLDKIEESGIDAARFWDKLYYADMPRTYEATRSANPVDFLASGIFGSHFVNTVSPTFLDEICGGRHQFVPEGLRQELLYKRDAGCAFGILNAPDPSYNPGVDPGLTHRYGPDDHAQGKRMNKQMLQERLGLIRDEHAPVLFWPSRLDPAQKGCQLLADTFYALVSAYWHQNLQIVIIANGPFKNHYNDIINHHGLYQRAAIRNFNEELSRLAFAASDFILMPSSFEPCGLPQMIGAIYGSLPVVYNTGGLHDTVTHLDVANNSGNGFVFEHHDKQGFLWAIDQALSFYGLPAEIKQAHIARIMKQSAERFTHSATAKHYFDLYEKMVDRPLVNNGN